MIVRIMGEGQFRIGGVLLDELNDLDNKVVEAVENDDVQGFKQSFDQMLDLVRKKSVPLFVDELVESDLILPSEDTTFQEAQALFTGEGLISG